jgi:hypothetical protein
MQCARQFLIATGWRTRFEALPLLAAVLVVFIGVLGVGANIFGLPQAKTIPAGTELIGELTDELDTRLLDEEGRFTLRMTQSVLVGRTEVIPRGTQIVGNAATRQDEDGNYSTLVLTFKELAIGMRTVPVAIKVKALEPPLPPRAEGEGAPPDATGQRLPGDPDRLPGERRRPRVETSGGISIRKIEDPTAGLGKPSKAGLRRESVELMKVSEAESGASEIFLEAQDIALRRGTRFRIVLTKDLVIN